MPTEHHSLKAILFADAAGYSRMVHERQQATLELMQRCFSQFRKCIAGHHGKFVKTTGDGVMAEFASSVSAVECALAVQMEIGELTSSLEASRQARFRIGIHLGEVQDEGGDLYGHIVNVAARIEAFAEPGGVCISEAVFHQVRHTLALSFRDLGAKYLKNIPEPVVLYAIAPSASLANAPSALGPVMAEVSVVDEVAIRAKNMEMRVPGSIHARAMIAYLALSAGHTASRAAVERVVFDALAPALSRKKLQASLQYARLIFSQIGPGIFHSDRNTLSLSPERTKVDLIAIAHAIESSDIDPRLMEPEPLSKRVLAGLEPIGATYKAWLEVSRHNWHNKLLSLLETCLAAHAGDPKISKQAASALVSQDASHEVAYRRLIEIHALEGNVPAALRLYETFASKVRAEFGAEPSEQTRRLVEQIRSPGGQKALEATASASPGIARGAYRLPQIEIAAFKTGQLAADEQDRMFGFRAEIIGALMRFRDWVITEPGGQESVLKADYRMTASCDKTHTGISLTMLLQGASDNRYVWSETYALTSEAWMAVQRDVVRKTAASVNIYLSAERVSTRRTSMGQFMQPYDNWLRGEGLLNRWEAASAAEAEEIFTGVISAMPDFAPAYCSLASSLNIKHLVFPGVERSPERVSKALALARKAVEIDPLETRAQLTLGWSYAMSGQFDLAEVHYDLAYQLNPNNPRTLISCAQGYAFTGNYERAEVLEKSALELTAILPGFLWAYISSSRYLRGDFDGSVDAANRAGNAILDMPGWKAISLVALGRNDEARQSGHELVELVQTQWTGEQPFSETQTTKWFLSSFPIRDPNTIATMNQRILQSGLKVENHIQ